MGRKRSEKGLPNPSVLIGGVPRHELERLAALPVRPLKVEDVPREPWREDYADYRLRQDDVVLAPASSTLSVPLGEVRPDGTIAWYR